MDARIPPVQLNDCKVWARHLTNFGPLCPIGLVACALAFHRVPDGTPLIGRAVYGLVVALNAVRVGDVGLECPCWERPSASWPGSG